MLVNRYLVLARRAPSLQTAPGRREPHRGARHARPADRPGTGTARLAQADAEPRQQRGAPRLHAAGAVLRPVLRGRGRPGRRTAPPRARLRSGHPWAGGLRGGVLRLVALRDVRWVPSAAEPMHGSLEEGRIRIVTSIGERIAGELGVRPGQVVAAIELLDGGATVPFIARYRKEMTGTLDDAQLRTLEDRLGYLRELEERRAAVIESIRGQDKLDPELEAQILAADSKARLEDLYLPFRPKRRTKAQVAREAGLEPLADRLLADPGRALRRGRRPDRRPARADVVARLAGVARARRQAGGRRQVRGLLRLRRAVLQAALAPDPGDVPRRERGGPRPHLRPRPRPAGGGRGARAGGGGHLDPFRARRLRAGGGGAVRGGGPGAAGGPLAVGDGAVGLAHAHPGAPRPRPACPPLAGGRGRGGAGIRRQPPRSAAGRSRRHARDHGPRPGLPHGGSRSRWSTRPARWWPPRRSIRTSRSVAGTRGWGRWRGWRARTRSS